MRFAIFGCGAVGSYLGAKLVANGNSVVFADIGAREREIRQNGIQVRAVDGDVSLASVSLLGDLAQPGFFDVLFVCVRAWDLETVFTRIKPLLAWDGSVIVTAKGIEHEEAAAAELGRDLIVGACLNLAAELSANVVKQFYPQPSMLLGELETSDSWRLETITAALSAAGIKANISEDIYIDKWRDFIIEAAVSALCCRYRCNYRHALGHDSGFAFASLVEEAAAVSAAQGIELEEDLVEQCRSIVRARPEDDRPLMVKDLEHSRPIERESIIGAVVECGSQNGVSTPLFKEIYDSLASIENQKARPA